VKAFVITLRRSSSRERLASLEDHLKTRGITDWTPYYGVDAKAFGLDTRMTYDVDNPGSNFKIGTSVIGCTMSHWSLWTLLEFLREHRGETDPVMILEDDARFQFNAMEKIEQAMKDLPENWDMLFPGSCCAEPHIKSTVRPGLVECWPLCTHCYIVNPRSLRRLIISNSMVWAPIDIQMTFTSFPMMKVFAILPRVVDQPETKLPN